MLYVHYSGLSLYFCVWYNTLPLFCTDTYSSTVKTILNKWCVLYDELDPIGKKRSTLHGLSRYHIVFVCRTPCV